MFTRPKDRRQRILEFISRYINEHGHAPSVREIGAEVDIRSTKAVKYHLDRLVEDGLLERVPGRARSLRTASRPDSLPIIGRIAAGTPVLAVENVESHISLSRYQDSFLLRVAGESMRDAGIMDGDLVIIRQGIEPNNGDIVAALLGDEATVKRFRRGDGRVVLEPENPDFKPVVVDPARDDFQVIGVVVGLLRNYK
jgi:repressor LexA